MNNGTYPTGMSCHKCGAELWAVWENGVIDHYKFMRPLEGCCCEVRWIDHHTNTRWVRLEGLEA